MKNLKLITSLFLIVITAAFTFKSEDTEKLIIGKWKFDVKASKESYEKTFVPGNNPESDAMAKGIIEYIFQMYASTVTEYKASGEVINITSDQRPDGTIKTKTSVGTWKLSKDKKSILVTDKGQESSLQIISISKEKMQLSMKNKGESLVLVYVPAL